MCFNKTHKSTYTTQKWLTNQKQNLTEEKKNVAVMCVDNQLILKISNSLNSCSNICMIFFFHRTLLLLHKDSVFIYVGILVSSSYNGVHITYMRMMMIQTVHVHIYEKNIEQDSTGARSRPYEFA